jgi:hypothetical protein
MLQPLIGDRILTEGQFFHLGHFGQMDQACVGDIRRGEP